MTYRAAMKSSNINSNGSEKRKAKMKASERNRSEK